MNRKRVVLLVGLVTLISILALLRLDIVRLGPSSVTLPADALVVTATWYRLSDSNLEHDGYNFLVRVQNRLDSESIFPFSIDVNISAPGAEIILGWRPLAGDHGREETVTMNLHASAERITLELPAGLVHNHGGTTYFAWSVRGERGLASQPVFRDRADFFLDTVIFPQNATMEAHVEVVLTWYYANPFQAYPMASRKAEALCSYVPEPGSEGSTPQAPCG